MKRKRHSDDTDHVAERIAAALRAPIRQPLRLPAQIEPIDLPTWRLRKLKSAAAKRQRSQYVRWIPDSDGPEAA